MLLRFARATDTNAFKAIHEYTVDAFSDTDFNWTLEDIQKEVDNGWEVWSAHKTEDDEIVAALFVRLEGDTLLTKNSGLKINHRGSGYSHTIKEEFEEIAKNKGACFISHYCRIDDFRAYSLNEGHGYAKVADGLGEDQQIVEWVKELK